MDEIELDFTEAVGPLAWDELDHYPDLGIRPSKEHEDFPEYQFIPWDCGIDIEGDDLVLEGGAGESGYGFVSVRIPKKDQKHCYRITLSCEEENMEKIRKCLEACGVKILNRSKENA